MEDDRTSRERHFERWSSPGSFASTSEEKRNERDTSMETFVSFESDCHIHYVSKKLRRTKIVHVEHSETTESVVSVDVAPWMLKIETWLELHVSWRQEVVESRWEESRSDNDLRRIRAGIRGSGTTVGFCPTERVRIIPRTKFGTDDQSVKSKRM